MNRVFKFQKRCLLLIITISSIAIQSCRRDDVYNKLNDEARGFLAFDIGHTFKLKNLQTGDTLNLKVISKENDFYKNYNPVPIYLFGSPGDVYYEFGNLSFIDDSGCYRGNIYVKLEEENQYTINISVDDCFEKHYYQTPDFIGLIDVMGTEYHDSYIFSDGPYKLFYSKAKGILKIVDYENVVKFSIVE